MRETQLNLFQFSPAAQSLKGKPPSVPLASQERKNKSSPGWLPTSVSTHQKGRGPLPFPGERHWGGRPGRGPDGPSDISFSPACHVDASLSPPMGVLAITLGTMLLE